MQDFLSPTSGTQEHLTMEWIDDPSPQNLNPPQPPPVGDSIAFIDAAIATQTDLQAIDADHIFQIRPEENGIDQITEVLTQFESVQSLHFINHGEAGELGFGSQTLNLNTLDNFSDDLQSWGDSLSETGDLLFYGCHVAGSLDGGELLQKVAELTDADIQASDDLTGNSGDWDLEFSLGNIESLSVLTQEWRQSYSGTLAEESHSDLWEIHEGLATITPHDHSHNDDHPHSEDHQHSDRNIFTNRVGHDHDEEHDHHDHGEAIGEIEAWVEHDHAQEHDHDEPWEEHDHDHQHSDRNIFTNRAGHNHAGEHDHHDHGELIGETEVWEEHDQEEAHDHHSEHEEHGQHEHQNNGKSIGETGALENLTHRWQKIELEGQYDNAVVIAGPPSRSGNEPTTVRVRNVTESSFEVRLNEWGYLNQKHQPESIGYLVIEAGTHTLADGTTIAAGNQQNVNHQWQNIELEDTFENNPLIFAQTQSNNEASAVTERIRSINTSGFEIRLQEQEAGEGSNGKRHRPETLSWIALESGNGDLGSLDYTAQSIQLNHRGAEVNFDTDFDNAPIVLASSNSFQGGNPFALRTTQVTPNGLSIALEEEQSKDDETKHFAESTAVLAIEAGQIWAKDSTDREPPIITDPGPTLPEAILNREDITRPIGKTLEFQVTYQDDSGISIDSLGPNDIRVTGPNGFTQEATPLLVSDVTDGPVRIVTYGVDALGDNWDSETNGTYQVFINADEVLDDDGNAIPVGLIDEFEIQIPESSIIFQDDFENSSGWTVNATGDDTGTSGVWEIGNPEETGTEFNTFQLGSPTSASQALITGLTAGNSNDANDVDGGVVSILSPKIELPDQDNIGLSLNYFFANDVNADPDDQFTISIIGESDSEVLLQENGFSVDRAGVWTPFEIDLSEYRGEKINLKVEAQDVEQDSLIEAGLDDILIELGGIQDQEAPTFGLTAIDLRRSTEAPYQFSIGINDESAVDVATLDNADIRVIGPNGYEQTARLATINNPTNGARRTAFYEITSEDGGWTAADNGNYRIELLDRAVADILGNESSAQSLGEFDIDIEPQGDELLPDLFSVSEAMLDDLFLDTTTAYGRVLLRVTSEIANIGDGPLEIFGEAPASIDSPNQPVFQRIYNADGTSRDRFSGEFEFNAAHNHVHFDAFNRFRLREVLTDGGVGDVIVEGEKTSFALLNVTQPFPFLAEATPVADGRGGSSAGDIQGISVGSSDVYSSLLPNQWIDMTNVESGEYWIETIADPDNTILETDETNNSSFLRYQFEHPNPDLIGTADTPYRVASL